MSGRARAAAAVSGAMVLLLATAAACRPPVAPKISSVLGIASADLLSCAAAVEASPLTCDVAAVVANESAVAATLDYSRLLLTDGEGASYPPISPTGQTTVAGRSSVPVSLSFLIIAGRTPAQLTLVGADRGPSAAAVLTKAAGPAPTEAVSSSASTAPSPSHPPAPVRSSVSARPSHAAPTTAAPPVYVPPPAYVPPPVYVPPPSPVSGGFG